MKQVDNPKAKEALDKIIEILNTSDLTIVDQLLVIANLTMSTGASLAGFDGDMPAMEVLQHLDIVDPTIDVALMMQGLLMTQWVNDFKSKPVLSDLAKKIQE